MREKCRPVSIDRRQAQAPAKAMGPKLGLVDQQTKGRAAVRGQDGTDGALLATRPAVPEQRVFGENRLRTSGQQQRGRRHIVDRVHGAQSGGLRSAGFGVRSAVPQRAVRSARFRIRSAVVPVGLLQRQQGTGADHRDHYQRIERVAAGAADASAAARDQTRERADPGVLRKIQKKSQFVRRQRRHHI